MSSGSGASEWAFPSALSKEFEFGCAYRQSASASSDSTQLNSSMGIPTVSSRQPPGHFRIGCPIDWTLSVLSVNVTYSIGGSSVTLEVTNLVEALRFYSARKMSDSLVVVGPIPEGHLDQAKGAVFCRFRGDAGEILYSRLLLHELEGRCSMPLFNWAPLS